MTLSISHRVSLTCVLAGLALLGAAAPARAIPIPYSALLTGPAEVPTNASPGIGQALVVIDTTPGVDTLFVNVTFSGLIGTTTASHIHAATSTPFAGIAGVATTTPTFTGFPLGVTSGVYTHLFDLTLASSYNPSYISANGGTPASAEAALAAAMAAGESYLNIHSTFATGGEIRGFLAPASIPEPVTAGTSLLALAGLGLAALRRSRA